MVAVTVHVKPRAWMEGAAAETVCVCVCGEGRHGHGNARASMASMGVDRRRCA